MPYKKKLGKLYYIIKNGYYYRPKSSGYTEYRRYAGVYTEAEIEEHKSCKELRFCQIDVENHNNHLKQEMAIIELNLIK